MKARIVCSMCSVIGLSILSIMAVANTGHKVLASTIADQPIVEFDFQTEESEIETDAVEETEEIPATDESENDTYVELNEEDEYLLAKIAMAEAEDQTTEGKALVMLVVLNRVNSDRFPDSVSDVIWEDGQFSPVADGRYDAVEPDADCWKALDLVRSGWDGSCGALYFESKSKSTWHSKNLKFLFCEDSHYFYTDKE